MSFLGIGCVHAPLIDRPETCAPLPDQIICPSKTYTFGDPPDLGDIEAGGFVCYKPEDIEPFLERCGK